MSGRYLLDANIVIALFREDAEVVHRVDEADEVFVPVVAVGELIYGARKSGRPDENLSRVRDFHEAVTVLPIGTNTAERYGEIKDVLRSKGRPIPDNDIWIGALALQHGLTLVSRDEHFGEIEGLDLQKW
jgi:tRNA(fMet)-specific endonuclease VapC